MSLSGLPSISTIRIDFPSSDDWFSEPAVVEGIELLRQGGTFVEEGHFVDVGTSRSTPIGTCAPRTSASSDR